MNVCLNDNIASRAFRKNEKYCGICGREYLKISVYMGTSVDGHPNFVLELVKDDPSVLGV